MRSKKCLTIIVAVFLSVVACKLKFSVASTFEAKVTNVDTCFDRNLHQSKEEFWSSAKNELSALLPTRLVSRTWGIAAETKIPKFLRSITYKGYSKAFGINLTEIEKPLNAYESLSDFFVRSLKPGTRPIANSSLVAPSDGTVLSFGPIHSCLIKEVKGLNYDLQYFLGGTCKDQETRKTLIKSCSDYTKNILKNPYNNTLYQITIYLGPGDYHRFHSPADWKIYMRKHFSGKLYNVRISVVNENENLYSTNERVIYFGEWEHGFMTYAAVGATNVGSIHVFSDPNLKTNKATWGPKTGDLDEYILPEIVNMQRGQLFGEFRMGSTIILIFEAPLNFEMSLVQGQKIQVGQNLIRSKPLVS